MQRCTREGLKPAGAQERRCEIVCILNATKGREDAKLIEMWESCTPDQARETLSKGDVVVTNAGDKDIQLAKIQTLDATVREAFDGTAAASLVAQGMATAADLRAEGDDGFALAALLEGGWPLKDLRGRFGSRLWTD